MQMTSTHTEMKVKQRLEYVRRVKTILKSYLNNRNVITAISARAVLIIRYTRFFLYKKLGSAPSTKSFLISHENFTIIVLKVS